MELKNYCLDIEKINKISEKDIREKLHEYYQQMVIYKYVDKNDDLSINYFNTLNNGGYLIDLRNEKIDKVLS
jgi:hypothetical protein